ncbi:MAG: hypothetical protein AB7K68_09035 [Bacteriovoracia bacterium]
MIRATLKPYWTGTAALVLSAIAWAVLIHSERTGEIEGNVAWVNGNLWTALFFAVPLSQVITKLFARLAGPSRNRLAHATVSVTAFFFAFGILVLLLFVCSESMMQGFRVWSPD